LELLQNLAREALNAGVIKITWDSAGFKAFKVIHLVGLTVDISLVLDLDLDLFPHGWILVPF